MRRGEVCGLRWSDVDLSAGTLTVARSVAVVDGARVEGEPKTRGSRRTIALDAATVEYLRALRASRPTGLNAMPPAEARGTQWGRSEDRRLVSQWSHVITKPDGEPYHPQTVSRTFDRYVAKLGPPSIRLHDLRHTFATLALEAGVHVRVVADRLGHSSPTITLTIYSHSTPKLDREAAEAVSRLVTRRT